MLGQAPAKSSKTKTKGQKILNRNSWLLSLEEWGLTTYSAKLEIGNWS